MYDQFNVTGYMPNPLSDINSVLACILNVLIMGLNDSKKLPRVLLVAPDQEIPKYIDYFDTGKSHVIRSTLEWLVNNIDRAITCKKEDLKHQKIGTVIANEPRIIWIKMLAKSTNDTSERKDPVNELVEVFNKILEEILSTCRNNFILDVNEEMKQDASYRMQGCLSGHGKVCFWRAVDKIIEKFDRYEISLRPISAAERENIRKKQAERDERNRQLTNLAQPPRQNMGGFFRKKKNSTRGKN